MRQHLRTHFIAYLALFVALGGTSYAATSLPRNSVGGKQLRASAVTSKKIKNGTITAKDLKAGTLPTGPAGPVGPKGADGAPGPKGDTGESGSARAFAHILVKNAVATVDASRAKGIATANVQRKDVGIICFKGLGFTPRSLNAMSDASLSPTSVLGGALAPDPAVLAVCGGDADAAVATQKLDNGAFQNVDHDFYVTFE